MDTQEKKQLREEIKKKTRLLGLPPVPELTIQMEVKLGDEVLHDHQEEAHSWTRNGWNIMTAQMFQIQPCLSGDFGVGAFGLTKTNGDIQSVDADLITQGNRCLSAAANSGDGVVVGTSGAVFNTEHYQLQGLISHGVIAGTLSYVTMTIAAPAYTVGTKTWKASIKRIFNNLSGGTITVAEVGLVSNNNGLSTFLTARDVLAEAVDVIDNAQLTVIYGVFVDFSDIDS